MNLIDTLTGLLSLEEPQVLAIERMAELAPELFAVPREELFRLTALLRRSPSSSGPTAPEELAAQQPTPPQMEELRDKALEVAQTDPTGPALIAGWEVIGCRCGRRFQVPRLQMSLPTKCYLCLTPQGKKNRLQLLMAGLAQLR